MQPKNSLTRTIQPSHLHKNASQQIQTQHPSRPWILAKALVSHLPLVLLLWSTCWLLTGCKRSYSSLVQEPPVLGSCYMLNTPVLTVESSEQSFKQFFTAHQAQDVWDWICLFRQKADWCWMDETIVDRDSKISNILSKREPKDRAELKDAIITYMQHIKRDTPHMDSHERAFRDLLHANALNEIWEKLKQAKWQDTLDLSRMLQRRSEEFQIEVLQGIVQFIRKHCPKVVSFNLSDNGLTKLPDDFLTLTQLEILNLDANHLTKLPDNFGLLEKLNELDLRDNNLCVLPKSFGRFRELRLLDLSENQLRELPDTFLYLINLNDLDLSDNDLDELPNSFERLYQLRILNLSENQLTKLPDNFGELINLHMLDLSNNQLTRLPDNLGNLTQLQILDLSDNQLQALPVSLVNLTQLQKLFLSANQLTVLPDNLGNLTQLQKLDLSNNQLSRLPDNLRNLTQLQELDLQHNQLIALPASLGNLTQLQKLHLSENRLKALPAYLLDLTQLQIYINKTT